MGYFYLKIKLLSDDSYFLVKSFISKVLHYVAIFLLYFNESLAVSYLMASIRFKLNPRSLKLMKENLSVLERNLGSFVSSGVSIEEAANRSIIIKWPICSNRNIEKGILIITFTKTNSYYYENINIEELCKYFHIVLEPSWAGYMDADIMFWSFLTSNPVWVQSTDINDRAMLNSLNTNLLPLSFGASDWVDFESFNQKNESRIYDSVYVANTNPIKRVYRYLLAIREIIDNDDPDYKGLLVCADWGGGSDLVVKMIENLDLEKHCEIMFSLDKKNLLSALNSSKVNVLLSFKEGSNRSLFESMFCNLPVIALAENIGVNKSYINEFTGLLVLDAFFKDALLYMKANYTLYTPRKWALKNISPEITSAKLIDAISQRDKMFKPDNGDVFCKVNNPEVAYLDNRKFSHNKYSIEVLELFDKSKQISDLSDKLNKLKANFKGEFSGNVKCP